MRVDRRQMLERLGLAALVGGAIGALPGLGPGAAMAADDGSPLPFDPPAQTSLRGSERKVFAHWHIFRLSMDNREPDIDYYTKAMTPTAEKGQFADVGGYFRERPLPRPSRSRAKTWLADDMATDIGQAAAAGIDGFIFNIISLKQDTPYWQNLVAVLEAARRGGDGFAIMPSIDCASMKNADAEEVGRAMVDLSKDEAIYRVPDGRMVLSCFLVEAKPLEWWRTVLSTCADEDVKLFFQPTFLDWRAYPTYKEICDGVSVWRSNTLREVAGVRGWGKTVKADGKLWAAPVWPQDSRPKNKMYFEASNSELFRQNWQSAIDDRADMAAVITWNDYSEASEIRPSTGIQYAFADLAAYYSAWFKTGEQPAIVRDVLYYFHRNQPVGDQVAAQAVSYTLRGGNPTNDIELLGFLTAPGRLQIEIGGETKSQDAPAGITSFRVPIGPGRPRFKLERDGAAVIDFESAFDISTTRRFPDMLYRAGSSSRLPVPMLANPPF